MLISRINTIRHQPTCFRGSVYTKTLEALREKYEKMPDETIKSIYKTTCFDEMSELEYDMLKNICRERFFNPKTFTKPDISSHDKIYNDNRCIRDFLSTPEQNREAIWAGLLNGKYCQMMLDDIDDIDQQFAQLKQLEKNCVFYRGAGSKHEENVLLNTQVGDTVVPDIGYSHVSFDRDFAESYATSIFYEIRVPKGARISRKWRYGGEGIMPRGAEYKLVSKEIGKIDHRENERETLKVVLEYILPKD